MLISIATPKDFNTLRELIYRCVPAEEWSVWSKRFCDVIKRHEDIFCGRDGLCLVAKENKEIIGYALIDLMPHPRSDSFRSEIMAVAVKEEYQNRGYGQALIDRAISECKCVDRPNIIIKVAPGNDRAKHIYKKQGFHEVELVMELDS